MNTVEKEMFLIKTGCLLFASVFVMLVETGFGSTQLSLLQFVCGAFLLGGSVWTPWTIIKHYLFRNNSVSDHATCLLFMTVAGITTFIFLPFNAPQSLWWQWFMFPLVCFHEAIWLFIGIAKS